MNASLQTLFLLLGIFVAQHAADLESDFNVTPDLQSMNDKEFLAYGQQLQKRMDKEMTVGKTIDNIRNKAWEQQIIVSSDKMWTFLNDAIKDQNTKTDQINAQIRNFNNDALRRKKKCFFCNLFD